MFDKMYAAALSSDDARMFLLAIVLLSSQRCLLHFIGVKKIAERFSRMSVVTLGKFALVDCALDAGERDIGDYLMRQKKRYYIFAIVVDCRPHKTSTRRSLASWAYFWQDVNCLLIQIEGVTIC